MYIFHKARRTHCLSPALPAYSLVEHDVGLIIAMSHAHKVPDTTLIGAPDRQVRMRSEMDIYTRRLTRDYPARQCNIWANTLPEQAPTHCYYMYMYNASISSTHM